MTSRDLVFWLQGFLEISAASGDPTRGLTVDQVNCIKKHLALVFIHEIDPSVPEEQQGALDEAHNPIQLPRPPFKLPGSDIQYRC